MLKFLMWEKRTFSVLIIFYLIFLPGCLKREHRPNIVLILVDCLRADYLRQYGFEQNRAPFLNSLFKKSTYFERVFSASSWTAPSTASMFTGLYPFQHGVTMGLLAQMKLIEKDPTIRINRIPEKVETLPEKLKKAGYATFGFSDNSNISPKQGFDQGFDLLRYWSKQGADFINQNIIALSAKIKQSSPYFLYIHYNDLHMPYKIELPESEQTADQAMNLKKRYGLELSFVDQKIAELFKTFGWEKNTLLIFVADHGEEFNEKGFYGHGKSLYNTVIHIPLFFYYPENNFFKSQIISKNVSNIDIFPTLLEFLGLKIPDNISGESLLKLIKGEKTENRFILSHLHLRRIEKTELIMKAAIYKDFKYIYRFPKNEFFFSLKKDFQENFNVINEALKLSREFKAYYFNFEKNSVRFNPDYVGITLDPQAIQELKTLGYIH